jgi:maltose alpha-D-glucosyltransferase/alpha-amylase
MRSWVVLAALICSASIGNAGKSAPIADVSPVEPAHRESALPARWNETAAFMEIFIRSYKDSNGDGIGDLQGLTSKLDYLQSLGVTGLWLMPIGPSADRDHGYAQIDYRSINPDYGTMQDFETLLREAHKRGIGIIIDYVVNHSAVTNPLFIDASASASSPYRDWYVFSETNPKWKTFNHSPWHKVKSGSGYYYGIFDPLMPDWNLRNPRVVAYLQDTMRFWLNKGVDGFRFDAVTMLIEDGPGSFFNNPKNPGIVAQLTDVLKAYDNRYVICEASMKPEMYAKVCQHAFAFGTQDAIRDSVIKGLVQEPLIAQLRSSLRDLMPLTLQTHDSYVGDRLVNQFGLNGMGNYRVAAAIAILASPTPFSYYGEEIAMSNNGTGNDPGLRAPMSWTGDTRTAGFTTGTPYRDVAINVGQFNVDHETGDPESMLEFYRALYQVRKAHPVLATGEFRLLSRGNEPTLAFSRTSPDDRAIVIVNVSKTEQPVSLELGTPGKEFINVLATGSGSTPIKVTIDQSGRLNFVVGAKTAVVLAATARASAATAYHF